MGVCYEANYGIGYEVEATDEIQEDELEDGLSEYIAVNVGEQFTYFEVGSGYTDEDDNIYVVIKDAFKDGLDLTAKKKLLDKELARLKLKPISDFGDVGGLQVR